jgi:hypothetical protein
MPDNAVAVRAKTVSIAVAQVDFALNYRQGGGITAVVIRLLAYFSFAFITGMDGYLLVAPYAVFCVLVMHLVHQSRRAQMTRPVAQHSVPTASLVPNL